MRRALLVLVKLSVVCALLAWLVSSDKLDFGQIRVLVLSPTIFFANLALWCFAYVGLGGFRWFILLRGLALNISFSRVLPLQMIGFFFSTAMPGTVGGDIVKAFYVMREQRQQNKSSVVLAVLLDRVAGLTGLFVLAGLAVAFNPLFFLNDPALRPLALFVIGGLGVIGFGLGLAFFPFRPGRDPVERLLGGGLPGGVFLLSIYRALRSYRQRPMTLVAALALSCLLEGLALLYAMYLTGFLTGQQPTLALFSTIFPLGIMAAALPIAPGGLGVGHIAFERLFAVVGLTGGANVFNVMILGQLALNLLGLIPYLLYRARLPAVDEDIEQEYRSAF